MKVASIRIDGGTQPRAAINEDAVREYAEALKNGVAFPPVVVFHDGKDYWLADGFHRWHAHRHAGMGDIHAEVRNGTRRDAVLYAVGSNATHGLQRTNADKRCAVEMLLSDPDWSKWSDHEIARRASVSHTLVSNIRRSLKTVFSEGKVQQRVASLATVASDSGTEPNVTSLATVASEGTVGNSQNVSTPQERTFTSRHGTLATMRTDGINADRRHEVQPVPKAVEQIAPRREAPQPQRPAPVESPEPTTARRAPERVAERQPTESEQLQARIEALEEEVRTLARELDAATKDNIAMGEAFDADDKLSVLHRQNQELRELNRVLQSRLDGEINTNGELKRAVLSAQRKIERLEKARG